uniref:OTU domain-containing protein n=1 Tax=Biomphalaria glabrata TaxID=6526 RepID=A0A2C9KR82_BIOGL
MPFPRVDFLQLELRLSRKTIIDWSSFLREVCEHYVHTNFEMLGGEGKIVEIDEAKFGRSKNNKGRFLRGTWVFGGIERDSKKCFVIPVKDRTKETLLQIIKERILPGTTIMSDCWRSYDCLSSEGYRHLTVNHSYNFVNPETKAHTQHIERLWREVRWNIPKAGNKRHHMSGHLMEFLFRFKNSIYQKRFHEIFKNIGTLYRPISTDYDPKTAQETTPPETEPVGIRETMPQTTITTHSLVEPIMTAKESMSMSQITTITKHSDMTPSLEITSIPTTLLPITFPQLEKEMIKQKRMIIKIAADGNCFFRAISQIIFLTQDQHRNMRKQVTSFMITHEKNFEMFVDGDFKQHMELMKKDTTWATTAEILAAATLLQRDIYTFSPNHKKTKYS